MGSSIHFVVSQPRLHVQKCDLVSHLVKIQFLNTCALFYVIVKGISKGFRMAAEPKRIRKLDENVNKIAAREVNIFFNSCEY